MTQRTNPGKIENAALLVIDVQQGLFERATKVYQAEQFLDNLNCLIDAARETDTPVIFIQHENQNTLKRDSDTWQLHPRIQPNHEETLIHKQHGNAFFETSLQAKLASKDVGTLYITGLVTQGCVRATCLGALDLGYRLILVSDAHSTFSKSAKGIIEKWNATLTEAGAALITTAEVDFECLNR